MSTMKAVAQKAHVSITTVSNVINGNFSHVSPEMVTKIKAIIKELDYTPNMSARSLVKSNSQIIGVVNFQTSAAAGSINNPFQSTLLDAVEKTLTAQGYFMMVNTVKSEEALLRLLRCWSMDGLIVTGELGEGSLHGLFEANKPFVLVDSYLKNDEVLSIGLEDYRGGYLATQYLIEHGHRKIVFASQPPVPGGAISERLRGYRQALKEAHIPFNSGSIYHQELSVSSGIELGEKLASRGEMTAVVASSDILAAGIMSGLCAGGKSVPDDVSVIGFDDVDVCLLTNPRLTTVHQDLQIKGELAAEMIVRTLNKRKLISRNIVLPVNVVERDSVRSL